MKSEKVIEELTRLGTTLRSSEDKKVVLNAILEITRLNDENHSVWDMLEEIKSSEVENFRATIEAASASSMLRKIQLSLGKKHDKN